jgi:delta 1-pyrroline-5-carboxylate dehydrogenase
MASAVRKCVSEFLELSCKDVCAAVTPALVTKALIALLAVWLATKLLRRGPRRAPARPPRCVSRSRILQSSLSCSRREASAANGARSHSWRLTRRSAARDFVRGSGEPIVCASPATGEKLGTARAYTKQEVNARVAAARRAGEEWATTSFLERRALLMDMHDWILAHKFDIVEWSTLETGKTRAEAMCGEVMTALEKIRWTVAEGEKYLRTEWRDVPSLMLVKTARVEYFPCGVVATIVPWNYPFLNVVSHVATALFAGNACVVKVSEHASFTAEKIETMLRLRPRMRCAAHARSRARLTRFGDAEK